MSLKYSMRSTKIQFEMLIIRLNGLNSFLKMLKRNCTQFSLHNIAGDVEKRFNDLRQCDLYPSLSMKICITREMDAAVDRQRTCSSCISKIEENRQTYVADTTLLHDAAAPLLLLISLRRISCERRLLEIERSANLNQKRLGSKKKGRRTRWIWKNDKKRTDERRTREMSRAKHWSAAKSSSAIEVLIVLRFITVKSRLKRKCIWLVR